MLQKRISSMTSFVSNLTSLMWDYIGSFYKVGFLTILLCFRNKMVQIILWFFSVYDFKALKSLTLTPDSGWYPRGGGAKCTISATSDHCRENRGL